jgi:hypothetical protein
MARVTYSGEKIEGVEIKDLAPCQPGVNRAAPASSLSRLWS